MKKRKEGKKTINTKEHNSVSGKSSNQMELTFIHASPKHFLHNL